MKNIIGHIGIVTFGFGLGCKIGKSIKNKNVCFVLGCTTLGLSVGLTVGLTGITVHNFNTPTSK